MIKIIIFNIIRKIVGIFIKKEVPKLENYIEQKPLIKNIMAKNEVKKVTVDLNQQLFDGVKNANEVLKQVRQIFRFPNSNILHDTVVNNEKSMNFEKNNLPVSLQETNEILQRLNKEFKHPTLSSLIKDAIINTDNLLEVLADNDGN